VIAFAPPVAEAGIPDDDARGRGGRETRHQDIAQAVGCEGLHEEMSPEEIQLVGRCAWHADTAGVAGRNHRAVIVEAAVACVVGDVGRACARPVETPGHET
jgi:hypothetical protein